MAYIPDEGGFEPPVIDFHELAVDIDALKDFITYLKAELDQNLQPYSNEIINDHWSGYPIAGFSASVPLTVFSNDYYQAVGAAVKGLESYLQETEVLVRALEILTKHYKGAEVMSVGRLGDVNAAMGIAAEQLAAEKAAVGVTPV